MAETKTKAGSQDFAAFAAAVEPQGRRSETLILESIFREATGFAPVIWGPSIVGYGRYRYRYDSGREGESLATGFSPRKAAISVYILPGYADFDDILKDLGPHKMGKSCLYIKDLSRIDQTVLVRLVRAGLKDLRSRWQIAPL